MKLYLTRHGETDWNKQLIIQGIIDNPLNQNGITQAQTLQEFFANKELDLIISSSLSRAIETATIATNTAPDIIDDRFIERNFGFFEGKDVSLFYETPDKSIYDDFEQDEMIVERVKQGLNEYSRTDNNTIAIFAHSHVLKAALSFIEPDNFNFSSKIKNCAIVELDVADGQINLVDIH
ncbi:histidine phosphatase family protein [Mollicutes bacterium LVI A0078]|nr:histidine phosphatase family protein [Mollicutes bacterium LVI A0075]WOO90801.1 histidine phosphatase family protein [Mollicutes bacterium LVI A0078]